MWQEERRHHLRQSSERLRRQQRKDRQRACQTGIGELVRGTETAEINLHRSEDPNMATFGDNDRAVKCSSYLRDPILLAGAGVYK